MTRFFRRLLVLLAGTALAGAGGLAAAQTYPSKPVRIVVPFGAGGVADDVVAKAKIEKQ